MAEIKYLANLDLNKNQLLNAVVHNLAVAPGTPLDGQIYWDTALDTLFIWSVDTGASGAWIDLGSDGITNLAYTAAVSQGTVTSDSGTNAIIPLADATNAGLFSAAEKAKLGGIDPGATDDQTASEVPSTPLGNLTSTNVQSALNELQADIDTNTTSNSGSVTVHSDVTNAGSGAIITSVERTKLNGIEALADVTDAANVNAAGAVMNSDTSTAAMGFVIDEDSMVSNSASKAPTQQSVKAYVDSQVISSKSYQGGYNAATNTPLLDVTPIAGIVSGDVYDVTVGGTFFTILVEAGDSLRANVDTPTLEAHWTIVQANLTAASIKTQYESNANTNAYTDADQTTVGNQSGINKGDEVQATTSIEGIARLATQSEVNTGTGTNTIVTPSRLKSTLGVTSSLSTTLTYNQLIGDASATSIEVTHDIGRKYVQSQVFDATFGDMVACEIENTSTEITTFKFNTAPTLNELRVVIIG